MTETIAVDPIQLGIDEVMNYLPHRYPFLLVDKVLACQPYESMTAVKNVSINEPFFQGHFPSKPIMPGVLLIESMAQAGAILAYVSTGKSPKDSMFMLASCDSVKFKRIVRPGDQLVHTVKLTGSKGNFYKMEGKTEVDGQVVFSAKIMSALVEDL